MFMGLAEPTCTAWHDLRPRDARYPTLPFWLDGTELNGWDQQSQPLCRTWGVHG